MYPLLNGLRVVEGAAFIAAPSCGLHLAQMGAEVIRFDAIGGGPDFKRWPLSPNGSSFYWEGLNKGKKSVALDLSRPEGRELAVALAAAPAEAGGLFVTDYPAGGFLSYDRLKAARDDIICLRVMGWPDGAAALDDTVNAAVGVPLMTGPLDAEGPVNHVLPAWDLLTGAYAAFALLAAERDRRSGGPGRELRIPLSDIAIATLGHLGLVAEAEVGGADRPRLGNDLYGSFGRDFLTADGRRIMVTATTPRQWGALVEALSLGADVAGLEEDYGVSFADEGERFLHRERLFRLFERAFAVRELAVLEPMFEAAGVCWAPYRTLKTAIEQDPRLVTENPMFATLAQPSGHSYPAPGAAATLPAQARGEPAAAPRLGQHTDEVLAQVLGLGSGEIGRLHDAGLVAGPAGEP